MDSILLGLIVLLGIAVGAGLNYLGDWLPQQRDIEMPIGWRRLRVWLVIILSALTSAWLWLNPHEDLGFWAALLLLAYFGLIVIIDMEHKLILYPTVWFGLVLGASYGIYLRGWLTTLLGGLAGFGIMLLLYFFGDFVARRLARVRNEELDEVALGFGDVNLAAIIGLLLGWPGILAGLVLAIFAGGAISILYVIFTYLLGRYQVFVALPYGPYLVFGAVVLLFF
ncbi:MAG: hypothetical protein DWQ07_11995 [Chloroflexi bacterium]|nr:MAG: hypothetical protein DWQ07_11995 [Chloroflexota bacterium]MBL1196080.1 hypothetical protein [Chloroflexota bacterium]NOH13374.1 prepilin peptidase [Chloroflexota bacterium]